MSSSIFVLCYHQFAFLLTLVSQVLWEFYVHYYHYEGLQMTSDIVRRVPLFVFYGSYSVVTNDSKKNMVTRVKPFYDWVHRKRNNARSRYSTKVEENFVNFIKLYSKSENNVLWKQILHDSSENIQSPDGLPYRF